MSNSYILKLTDNFFLQIFIQCEVDKLVFIDVAESSTKGGSTDLEIFSLPKVDVSRGKSLSVLSHHNVPLGRVIADWHCG